MTPDDVEVLEHDIPFQGYYRMETFRLRHRLGSRADHRGVQKGLGRFLLEHGLLERHANPQPVGPIANAGAGANLLGQVDQRIWTARCTSIRCLLPSVRTRMLRLLRLWNHSSCLQASTATNCFWHRLAISSTLFADRKNPSVRLGTESAFRNWCRLLASLKQ